MKYCNHYLASVIFKYICTDFLNLDPTTNFKFGFTNLYESFKPIRKSFVCLFVFCLLACLHVFFIIKTIWLVKNSWKFAIPLKFSEIMSQNFWKSPTCFDVRESKIKTSGRFFQILWPYYNILTLSWWWVAQKSWKSTNKIN